MFCNELSPKSMTWKRKWRDSHLYFRATLFINVARDFAWQGWKRMGYWIFVIFLFPTFVDLQILLRKFVQRKIVLKESE